MLWRRPCDRLDCRSRRACFSTEGGQAGGPSASGLDEEPVGCEWQQDVPDDEGGRAQRVVRPVPAPSLLLASFRRVQHRCTAARSLFRKQRVLCVTSNVPSWSLIAHEDNVSRAADAAAAAMHVAAGNARLESFLVRHATWWRLLQCKRHRCARQLLHDLQAHAHGRRARGRVGSRLRVCSSCSTGSLPCTCTCVATSTGAITTRTTGITVGCTCVVTGRRWWWRQLRQHHSDGVGEGGGVGGQVQGTEAGHDVLQLLLRWRRRRLPLLAALLALLPLLVLWLWRRRGGGWWRRRRGRVQAQQQVGDALGPQPVLRQVQLLQYVGTTAVPHALHLLQRRQSTPCVALALLLLLRVLRERGRGRTQSEIGGQRRR